jgi:hypothetical protein
VFLDLGASLDAIARGLERGDVEEARAGLERARALDDEIESLHAAIATSRDTARLAPSRWRAHSQLLVYDDAVHQLDRAVRNTRVLARAAVEYVRDGKQAPEPLVVAVRELSTAINPLRVRPSDAGARGSPAPPARERSVARFPLLSHRLPREGRRVAHASRGRLLARMIPMGRLPGTASVSTPTSRSDR